MQYQENNAVYSDEEMVGRLKADVNDDRLVEHKSQAVAASEYAKLLVSRILLLKKGGRDGSTGVIKL